MNDLTLTKRLTKVPLTKTFEVKKQRFKVLSVFGTSMAFNIWNTPYANWLQDSVNGEYCRNGRGVT